jgi:hypothetical protein
LNTTQICDRLQFLCHSISEENVNLLRREKEFLKRIDSLQMEITQKSQTPVTVQPNNLMKSYSSAVKGNETNCLILEPSVKAHNAENRAWYKSRQRVNSVVHNITKVRREDSKKICTKNVRSGRNGTIILETGSR